MTQPNKSSTVQLSLLMAFVPQTLFMIAGPLLAGGGDGDTKPDPAAIDRGQAKKFQTATFAMG